MRKPLRSATGSIGVVPYQAEAATALCGNAQLQPDYDRMYVPLGVVTKLMESAKESQ